MIFLVGAEEAAPVGFSGRIRRLFADDAPFKAEDIVALGVRMRRLTVETEPGIGAGRLHRCIERAAAYMRAARAGKIIYTADFPYKELFTREGFVEADAGGLMAALAGRIAGRAAPDGGTAVLFARVMTEGACRTLLEFCWTFRCVMVVTDAPDSFIFEDLRRRDGISVLVGPSEGQLRRAEAAVFFDPPRRELKLPPSCMAIEAAPGALNGVLCARTVSGIALGLRGNKTDLIQGVPPGKLLAAALDAGTLAPEDFIVQDVVVSGNSSAPVGPLDKNTSIYYNECSYTTDN